MRAMRSISKYLVAALAVVSPGIVQAQDTIAELITPEVAIYMVIGLIFVVAVIILGVSYNVYHIIRTVVRREEERKAREAGIEYVPEPSVWAKLMSRWTKAVPLEEEQSITLDHEYDGIRELDNHLPPWWLALFYGSIGFAAIYLFGYHVVGWWPLQEEEYEIAEARAAEILAARQAEEGVIDANTVEYNSDPVYLAQGKSVFDQSCATCHRVDGGGMVGPNLTDNYWLHGGSISEIYTVIKNGVPDKGMASWEKALSPTKMAQVSSYIISLNGTNPPDAKAPQGELVEPEGSTMDTEEEAPAEQETSETQDDGSGEQTGE